MLELNPFQGIAAPGKENSRDRVLSAAELGAVWRASEGLGTFQGLDNPIRTGAPTKDTHF